MIRGYLQTNIFPGYIFYGKMSTHRKNTHTEHIQTCHCHLHHIYLGYHHKNLERNRLAEQQNEMDDMKRKKKKLKFNKLIFLQKAAVFFCFFGK